MKTLIRFFIFVSISLSGFSQDLEVLDVEGIDLHSNQDLEFPHQPVQIRQQGKLLYLRNHMDRQMFVSTFNGELLRTVGLPGEGPEHLSGRLASFAVHGEHLFVISSKNGYRAFHFESGELVTSWPVAYELFCKASIETNPLIATPTHLIVPNHPKSGYLATAYDYDGNGTPFGDLILDKKNSDLLEENPCYNEMLWAFSGETLYAVGKYHPLVLQFDAKFNLVDSFTFSNSRLERIMAQKDELKQRFSAKSPPAIFTDCQIQGQSLYVMSSMTLFKLDLQTKSIAKAYAFHVTGKAAADKNPDNRVNFQTFALADNGKDMFLGPAISLDADILHTQLPEKNN